MKVTIKNGRDESSSELGVSSIEVCFNALRGIGMTDKEIIESMYKFSSQFVKVEEKPKENKKK